MKLTKKLTGLLVTLLVFLVINAYSAESVIYIQDGAIDELMVPVLLSTMDNVKLEGIVVVDGDCWAFPTAESQWKINSLISLDVPLGISKAEGVNPFPPKYRNDCLAVNALDILNPPGTKDNWKVYDGEELIAGIIKKATQPVTILLNCGATTLVTVLKKHPDLQKNISRVIWMGGAIAPNVGNVVYPPVGTGGKHYYCEWNMYWDPSDETGAGWLLKNAVFPIVLFPLDITDSFPLRFQQKPPSYPKDPTAVAFHDKLADQAKLYKYSKIVSACYAIEYDNTGNVFYCLWDTVTAVYIAHPEFFKMKNYDIKIVSSGGLGRVGNLLPEGHLITGKGGKKIQVAVGMADGKKISDVYDYMAKQYKR